MAAVSSLRHQIHRTLTWLAIIPIVAIWPFISTFPAFGILEATRFDWVTFLNSIFVLTGFWAVFGLSIAVWFIMGDQARGEARSSLHKLGALIGSYAYAWTILYIIFAIMKG